MAPRKKPLQRRNAQNPNTVLVVFLVFFVLLSIGLGVWGYYGYDGQKVFEEKAIKADNAAKAAKKAEEWALFQGFQARKAIGLNLMKDADVDEENANDVAQENFITSIDPDKVNFNAGSKFKDFKNKVVIEKMIEENIKILGWDAAGKKYQKNYRDVIAGLEKEVEKLKGDVADSVVKKDEAEKKAQDMQTKYSPFWDQAMKQIQDGNAKALAASSARTTEMDKLMELTRQLKKEKEDLDADAARKLRQKDKQILELTARLEALKPAAEPGAGANQAAAPRPAPIDAHALFLDVSTGRTLWDVPVGKILRVEAQGRRVFIDRGSAQGVQPQMTFAIFAPGADGRAHGAMKGTLEVQNILDGNTSVARVTSLYDARGQEIPLGETTRGIYSREAENPLKEGDLLFNLAWGSHVVIAGYISWDGYDPEAPAEQMRHLQRFMAMLRKQGVTVDAYQDPTDGQIKGKITQKAAYLVRGYVPEITPGGDQEAKKQQSKAIAEGIAAMKNEAADRGMFILSPENFLNVIGYRRPRSATDPRVSDLRLRVPVVGVAAGPG